MSRFRRYLEAKRTVDDRALNRRIWERLRDELKRIECHTLEVADVGAGIGIGAERMLEDGMLDGFRRTRYCALDVKEELLDEARKRLVGTPLDLKTFPEALRVFADLEENRGRFHLVVAHAFVDLFDLVPALRSLVRLLRPGGLLYLPITFDGESIFEPEDAADESILRHYHDSMNERGTSRAGRRVFHALDATGVEVLDVGSSDWVVVPRGGGYPHDEAFFLEVILDTVERAVQPRDETVRRWASLRRRQLERAELVYIAHQLDYLARRRS